MKIHLCPRRNHGREGDVTVIGEGSCVARKRLEKKNVKAIVLRIDSPGGSALTSDLIER
jgi:protease-4